MESGGPEPGGGVCGACGMGAAHGADGQIVAGLGSSFGSCSLTLRLLGAAGGFIRGAMISDRCFGMNVIELVESVSTGAKREPGGCREQSPGQQKVGGCWSSQGRWERSPGPGDSGSQRVWAASVRSGTDLQVSN